MESTKTIKKTTNPTWDNCKTRHLSKVFPAKILSFSCRGRRRTRRESRNGTRISRVCSFNKQSRAAKMPAVQTRCKYFWWGFEEIPILQELKVDTSKKCTKGKGSPKKFPIHNTAKQAPFPYYIKDIGYSYGCTQGFPTLICSEWRIKK